MLLIGLNLLPDVPRNERDFKASPVPAWSPEAFLRKYPSAPASA
jgi:hypothetical protein